MNLTKKLIEFLNFINIKNNIIKNNIIELIIMIGEHHLKSEFKLFC